MSTTRMTWVVAILAVAGLVGCKETVSSCNIKTPGLAELTTVTATSASFSTVRTALTVGGDESNTYAILECGDQLFAEADGDRKGMQAQAAGVFEAEFDVAAEDTEFRVILERPEDISAPDSQGTLPAPFEITSATEGTTFSRADDDVTITWEPSGTTDDMEISIRDETAGCFFDVLRHSIAGDPGTYTIAAGDLRTTNEDDPETCDAEVTLRRVRDGSADSHFDSESWFVLEHVRTTSFTSAP